jgi:MOSC domain-containing protein YiiM
MPPDDSELTTSAAARGRLDAIWLKRAHRGPMDPVDEAEAIAGRGLDGSVDRSRRRQVTILERERWEAFMHALDADLDPSTRRANLLVSGVVLTETRGRVLRIGSVRLLVGGHTTPCERMEQAWPGLQETMRPDWGGGAFAEVLDGGTLRVGDTVEWEPESGDAR